MDAASLRADGRRALDRARAAVQRFRELPGGADFAALARAFDRIGEALNGIAGRVHLFAQVHPDAEVRQTARELEQEIASFGTELSLDRGVYDRLSALDPRLAPGDSERRLVELSLRDYRRGGVDRDEATRTRIRALKEELVRIGQEFDRNIISGAREFLVEGGRAALAGLPADFLASHPEDERGRVALSTDPQDRLPVMTYAERGDVRRAYHEVSANVAYPQNLAVLDRLLARRHELATLLGYASWADYSTEDKMVKTGANARAFVARVIELSRERARAEVAELLEEKRRDDPSAGAVEEWDRLHLAERIKRRRYHFDSQSVRPYFGYERVRDGVLSTSAALYGVEFRRVQAPDPWHPSVESYEVLDASGARKGVPVARFHLDMHPRVDKFKHAAMFDLASGLEGECLPEACLVCNFPRPSAEDAALLEHDQVTTFFHEFGHLLHHLFAGRHRYLRFSGISTEWDFVEVPSQMYEEWAWDTGVLAGFARHHETGEPIREELVRRMRAADEYGKGLTVAVQMLYATLSLAYHERDPAGKDTTEVMERVKREVGLLPHAVGTHMQCSFGHLHGYSSGYYTYMWSLVIAKDLFSAFEGDLMDSSTANRYRATVLSRGGERDAAELVRDFLGRDYGYEAFEGWLRR